MDYNKDNNAMTYIQQREIMIQYLKLKVFLEDWHGVADAAMDIRELEAKYGKEIYEEKN